MPGAPLRVGVYGDRLRVDAPSGWARLALLAGLDVPVAHITEVVVVDRPIAAIRGWRTGIGLPRLRMGTWRHDGVKDYVAVRSDRAGVVLTLRAEQYERAIVSVPDPAGLAAAIAAAQAAPGAP